MSIVQRQWEQYAVPLAELTKHTLFMDNKGFRDSPSNVLRYISDEDLLREYTDRLNRRVQGMVSILEREEEEWRNKLQNLNSNSDRN